MNDADIRALGFGVGTTVGMAIFSAAGLIISILIYYHGHPLDITSGGQSSILQMGIFSSWKFVLIFAYPGNPFWYILSNAFFITLRSCNIYV